MVEPIQGEGGYVVPPPAFFPALRRVCDKYGILLIVDEAQSGMGRTGKWFAVEHEGIEPDVVAVAKGIVLGMSLGATPAPQELMSWPAGSRASTFDGNPVSCAAAPATLSLLENGMIDNAARMGDELRQRLREMMPDHPYIGDVRGRGLMVGAEIVKDRATRERAPELRDRMISEAFYHGLLLLGAGPNTLRFVPPLNVSPAHLDEALELFESVLTTAEAG
ncbi:MAG: aminotransferase class III-fold pyridoxal phosphate-dependent enzyme [Anaerolineae bacterium]|nr:aminotransferase class III-fold pyridoxal phosphate-dependent enzyme [Anaerolineae bacterium]